MTTVAAINGHAFAAGLMLALAHDFRIMRADRGYVCFPEIDLATGLPLTPGMSAVIDAKLSKAAAHDAILTGRRLGAPDAVAAAIVHEAVPEADVLPRAIELAAAFAGKHRPTMRALKRGIFAAQLAVLEQAAPEFVTGGRG
jgi:enoyl-CoA hydratase/carnithine racemase